ncbi:MAG TPA: SRPBCC domain-containing protein [Steroidobacteraceae bacterium]|jgi:uncharacterized protein YndB with AHSA1/START domain|nr:SRPBCC domain-containing protein [Steroidobacteraceae bacterium]
MIAQRARVSIRVDLPPALAFEIFTGEIDRWWRRGPRFRHAGQRGGFIRIEPQVGGRLFESIDSPHGQSVFEVGRVRVWQPPSRVAFSWRNANFAPEESTDVEVEFSATRSGTLVTVTHQGWEALPEEHPARHGTHGADFVRMIGMWWGQQMSSWRELTIEYRKP